VVAKLDASCVNIHARFAFPLLSRQLCISKRFRRPRRKSDRALAARLRRHCQSARTVLSCHTLGRALRSKFGILARAYWHDRHLLQTFHSFPAAALSSECFHAREGYTGSHCKETPKLIQKMPFLWRISRTWFVHNL
jgi:hypothetical protein